MSPLSVTMAALAGTALLGAAAAAALVWSGLYDIAATSQHTQPVFSLLEIAGQRSIRQHARDIAEQSLAGPQWARRGALCYRDKCIVCHGGPGVAQGEIGRSMQPVPGPLVDSARRFRTRELVWVIRHGIKMSGMPAWQYRMADADIWATVAFLQQLPGMDAAAFRAATLARSAESCDAPAEAAAAAADAAPDAAPDTARGRVAATQYACHACHIIPGITGSQVHVGPPLAGIASRQTIAGALPNTLENRAAWIRHPQRVDPKTTMPDLSVGERDARDIAAYLGTLH